MSVSVWFVTSSVQSKLGTRGNTKALNKRQFEIVCTTQEKALEISAREDTAIRISSFHSFWSITQIGDDLCLRISGYEHGGYESHNCKYFFHLSNYLIEICFVIGDKYTIF